MEKKRCQLAFDINEDMKYKIKEFALKRKITMNNWIHQVLYRALVIEEQFFKDKDEQ